MTENATTRLILRKRIGDTETPVSALLKMGPDVPGNFLFESIQGGTQLGRYSFVGLQPDLWWRVKNGIAETSLDKEFQKVLNRSDDPLADLKSLVAANTAESEDELPPMSAGLFGYLGYDMIRYFEPVGSKPDDVLDVPEAILVRPSVMLVFDHLYQDILMVAPLRRHEGETELDAKNRVDALLDSVERRLDSPTPIPPKGQDAQELDYASNKSKADYFKMVDKARTYIKAGDIFQVVPSQRFSANFPHSSMAMYRALRALNPSAFMFHMNLEGLQLVGSSPEILVRVRDGKMTIRPIAGTRPRSGDAEIDAARQADLLSDDKECAEHLMLLDLGRNDVGRATEFGSVKVTEQFKVERYSHVMHIVSNVEGKLRSDQTLIDALMSGFPAGTVSGAPKIRAMQIIDELEGQARGVYGGAVGYFGWKGDLDTCIALRTALIKDGQIHIQAGGGVVLDSDPQYEFDETVHKAQALMRASREAARFENPK